MLFCGQLIDCVSLPKSDVIIVVVVAVLHHLQTSSAFPLSAAKTDTSGRGRAIYEVRDPGRPDRYVNPQVYTLIRTLENVGILDSTGNRSSCFVLENITKEWRTQADDGAVSTVVQVSLFLRQVKVPESGAEGPREGRSKWTGDNSIEGKGNDCLEIYARTTPSPSPLPTSSQFTGSKDLEQTGSLLKTSGGMGPAVPQFEPTATNRPKEDEHAGLNKRQILVISTCSTVIGAFFVTAFILRIRNYMKRSKQDKDGARRHMRAASMPHPPSRLHRAGSLDHFASNENHRRWSHFNPFSTDR